jgi:hypothetical protein
MIASVNHLSAHSKKRDAGARFCACRQGKSGYGVTRCLHSKGFGFTTIAYGKRGEAT